MRRGFAVAALAAGMLMAAACGNNDDDGGQSTEEVCATLDEEVTPLEADLNTGISEVGAAAAQGDQAALAEAAVGLSATIDEIAGALRDAAGDAEDEEFSTALEAFATEFENLESSAASGQVPDLTPLETARANVEQFCGG
jgi:hypothetical protein